MTSIMILPRPYAAGDLVDEKEHEVQATQNKFEHGKPPRSLLRNAAEPVRSPLPEWGSRRTLYPAPRSGHHAQDAHDRLTLDTDTRPQVP